MDFRTAVESQLGAHSAEAQQINDRMNAVLARSATDQEFRRKLVDDPRSALAEFNGVDAATLPENFIRFIDSKGVPAVVLPDYENADEPLSEEQLETVSGGTTLVCVSIGITIGVTIMK